MLIAAWAMVDFQFIGIHISEYDNSYLIRGVLLEFYINNYNISDCTCCKADEQRRKNWIKTASSMAISVY